MFWTLYIGAAVIAIVFQAAFIIQAYNNYRYALQEAAKERGTYCPPTLLTVPCKGLDREFEGNIASFYALDYGNYVLHFVVESEEDAAYSVLERLRGHYADGSKAREVRVLVAGLTDSSSQKIHNLLYSCGQAPAGTAVFAFADSDACVKPYWLAHLVHPLRKDKTGATTGYRWFIPLELNAATLALYSINAKVAQLLGNTHFNQAWGGSMAIRADVFREVELERVWRNAVSDDLCLSWAVKKAGRKVVFVPGCVVASYERTHWRGLFEFGRRQFIITRITAPGTWWFGLFSSVFSLAGLWAGGAVAVIGALRSQGAWVWLYAAVPGVFLFGQLFRGILRQRTIARLLPEHIETLRKVRLWDTLGNFLWSWILLVIIISSAFRRTITWRNVTYRIESPTETVILHQPEG